MNFQMMKIFTVLAGIILILAAPTNQGSSDAEGIMKRVQEKYAAYKDMSISYQQMIVDAEGEVLSDSKGNLFIKNDLFRLEIEGQVMASDNKKIWIYFVEENELTIDFMEDDLGFKPSDIFNLYEKDFIFKLEEEKTIGGKVMQVIRFTPVNKDEYEFHTIKLTLQKDNLFLHKAEIIDQSNTVITYLIESIKPNNGLEDSFFRVSPEDHPGIIVSDNTN